MMEKDGSRQSVKTYCQRIARGDARGEHTLHRYRFYRFNKLNQETLRRIVEEIGLYQQELQEEDAKMEIFICQNRISGGCKAMAEAMGWQHLQQLSLFSCSLGDEDCLQLSRGNWPQLLRLSLSNNNIKDGGCLHVTQASWGQLQHIHLSKNQIGNAGCLYLSDSQWPNLKSLSLCNNQSIAHKGWKAISKAKWPQLQTLSLDSNTLGPIACKNLAKGDWKQLKSLSLQYSYIGDKGLEWLATADWPRLQLLYLRQTHITVKGCQTIAQTHWSFSRYRETVDLQKNQLGKQGYMCLKARCWKVACDKEYQET